MSNPTLCTTANDLSSIDFQQKHLTNHLY